MKDFDPEIKELQQKTSKQLVDSLKQDCINLKEKILENYDQTASNYVEKIYKSIRGELNDNVEQKLFSCFLNQIKRIIPMIQKFMRTDLQKKIVDGCKIV